ncbi:carboxylic ester hydrolase-like [Procambarus clarkii]|uniref:carboxylic ester hydrolase-like n=1 Tax=Procambarus clarkii TaxID=6728 RepID=UPI0037433C40
MCYVYCVNPKMRRGMGGVVVVVMVLVALVLVKAEGKTEAEPLEATVEVHLKQGAIFAAREEAGEGRYFYSFKGIPYAQPPVGDLRFRDPVPAEGWSQPKNGSLDPTVCPQLSYESLLQSQEEIIGSEDCLYLTVHTPNMCITSKQKIPSTSELACSKHGLAKIMSEKTNYVTFITAVKSSTMCYTYCGDCVQPRASHLPVMVWIHGGAFKSGGTATWNPPLPLLTRDIVLVVPRYRLGTLGFLSTEDSIMPGNLGLKDQTLALRWVHNNIRDLGGDPNKVTIFGESAGAASVHFQILSPSAKGLFRRAILQSGSALSSWALRENHRQVALQLGHKFNCTDAVSSSPTLESTQLLACLQQLPLQELVLANNHFTKWYDWPSVMLPRVDRDFLPAHPAHLLQQGIYNKVDLISGVNLHEGAMYSLKILAKKEMVEDLNQNFTLAGPVSLLFQEWEEAPVYLARRAYYHYMGDTLLTQDNAQQAAQLLSDRFFSVPHEETSELHTAAGLPLGHSLFKYQLQHRAQYSFTDLYNVSLKNHCKLRLVLLVDFVQPEAHVWVGHGDDLQYLFNSQPAILPPLQRPSDLFMRDIILTLWTNFATDG